MKKSKEFKIGSVLSCIALVLFLISIVTSLIPGLAFSIDKICMYLGFALLCLGSAFIKKAVDKNDKEDK